MVETIENASVNNHVLCWVAYQGIMTLRIERPESQCVICFIVLIIVKRFWNSPITVTLCMLLKSRQIRDV